MQLQFLLCLHGGRCKRNQLTPPFSQVHLVTAYCSLPYLLWETKKWTIKRTVADMRGPGKIERQHTDPPCNRTLANCFLRFNTQATWPLHLCFKWSNSCLQLATQLGGGIHVIIDLQSCQCRNNRIMEAFTKVPRKNNEAVWFVMAASIPLSGASKCFIEDEA